jgi:glycine oxidase
MSTAADVIIIGGGIIGLSIAIELRRRGYQVRVVTRELQEAAAQAAAGMLAPQAEEIPPGAMLDLCLLSRNLYPDWTAKLTALTGLETGYWDCGILAPRYVAPADADAIWQSRSELLTHQPDLSTEVVGGYWFPADGQVDNRSLYRCLQAAAMAIGVEVQAGVTVQSIAKCWPSQVATQGQVNCLHTNIGNMQADHYVLATGAWSQQLLSLPVVPRKGQLVALQVPPNTSLPLNTVLFGSDIYIVPRRDGRIVIGATSEDVGFTAANTSDGVAGLVARAQRLYPALANYPVIEQWWGFRPATPDELPILGESPYRNLTLATGHHRNGILLAPATAKIIADVLDQRCSELLPAFSYRRFTPVLAGC